MTDLSELRSAAAHLGLTVDQAIAEKARELRARLYFKCIPDEIISRDKVGAYLRLLLSEEPTPELVESVGRKPREQPLSEAQLVELERQQNLRCGLCGITLVASVKPHVDHIVPVVLGGASDLSNLQLLCRECNLGKGAVLDWVLGAEYTRVGSSPRTRYCALSRAHGRCEVPGCVADRSQGKMSVQPRIPRADGGRWILDNLQVVCERHVRVTPGAKAQRGGLSRFAVHGT